MMQFLGKIRYFRERQEEHRHVVDKAVLGFANIYLSLVPFFLRKHLIEFARTNEILSKAIVLERLRVDRLSIWKIVFNRICQRSRHVFVGKFSLQDLVFVLFFRR